MYDLFIGIDYSGAGAASSRLKPFQVYAARAGEKHNGMPVNWSRREVAEWLIGLAHEGMRFIAGIDPAPSGAPLACSKS